MDTLLQHKDHATDARGYPIEISGAAEKIQQAMIRLTVQKGSFALDPSLGSLLHTLGQAGEQELDGLAFQYAQQALVGMQDVRVERTSCTFGADAELHLDIALAVTTAGG